MKPKQMPTATPSRRAKNARPRRRRRRQAMRPPRARPKAPAHGVYVYRILSRISGSVTILTRYQSKAMDALRERLPEKVLCVLLWLAVCAGPAIFLKSAAGEELNWGCGPRMLKNEDPKAIIYKNFTTGPCYVNVRLLEKSSGDIFNMIMENPDFGFFLAGKRGFDCQQAKSFFETEYPAYMVALEGEVLPDATVEDIVVYLQRGRWSLSAADYRFRSLTYEEPLALSQLGVSSESELLGKFFDYHPSKYGDYFKPKAGALKGYAQVPFDPSFVALLMDLGYGVCRGDTDPTLSIHKRE